MVPSSSDASEPLTAWCFAGLSFGPPSPGDLDLFELWGSASSMARSIVSLVGPIWGAASGGGVMAGLVFTFGFALKKSLMSSEAVGMGERDLVRSRTGDLMRSLLMSLPVLRIGDLFLALPLWIP